MSFRGLYTILIWLFLKIENFQDYSKLLSPFIQTIVDQTNLVELILFRNFLHEVSSSYVSNFSVSNVKIIILVLSNYVL